MIKDLPYTERLNGLNLPSLSYGRKRGDDDNVLYKVMTNKVRLNKEKFFSLNKNKARAHIYKLHKNQREQNSHQVKALPLGRLTIGIACHQTLFRRYQPTTLKTSWISTGKVNDSNHLTCRN